MTPALSLLTHRTRLLVLAGIVMLLVALPAPTPPASAQSGEALPAITFLDDCQFDPSGELSFLLPSDEIPGETVECGVLETFEDPFDPDSNIITIAFVVLFAEGEPTDDPVIYLEGGPGGSGVLTTDSWVNHPLRATYDIILVDQRGTGYSTPSLSCELVPAAVEAEDDIAYFEACAASLRDRGVDFGTYNTINNGTDIAYLIQELQVEYGYGAVNLLGGSYGTRLGLAMLRDWPELVRSAVLDGVYPPELDAYAIDAQRTVDALLTLTEYCAADADCNTAFPDLDGALLDGIEALYLEPFYIEEDDYDYTGFDFALLLFDAMYDLGAIPFLPAVIDLVAAGEYDAALDLLFEGPPGYVDPLEDMPDPYADAGDAELDAFFETFDLITSADGMFMLVECQDEIAWSNVQDVDTDLPDLPDFLPEDFSFDLFDQSASMFFDCDLWLTQAAPERESQRVASDVPTLLLSGGLDPITPPAYGDSALQGLSRGQHVVVPFAAHGVIDAGPCPVQIMLDFYADPSAPVDTSCIADMALEFYVP
jgi:pimeloyl-ACP methyl ester carboxylesterase